jgi:hypothetical protein
MALMMLKLLIKPIVGIITPIFLKQVDDVLMNIMTDMNNIVDINIIKQIVELRKTKTIRVFLKKINEVAKAENAYIKKHNNEIIKKLNNENTNNENINDIIDEEVIENIDKIILNSNIPPNFNLNSLIEILKSILKLINEIQNTKLKNVKMDTLEKLTEYELDEIWAKDKEEKDKNENNKDKTDKSTNGQSGGKRQPIQSGAIQSGGGIISTAEDIVLCLIDDIIKNTETKLNNQIKSSFSGNQNKLADKILLIVGGKIKEEDAKLEEEKKQKEKKKLEEEKKLEQAKLQAGNQEIKELNKKIEELEKKLTEKNTHQASDNQETDKPSMSENVSTMVHSITSRITNLFKSSSSILEGKSKLLNYITNKIDKTITANIPYIINQNRFETTILTDLISGQSNKMFGGKLRTSKLNKSKKIKGGNLLSLTPMGQFQPIINCLIKNLVISLKSQMNTETQGIFKNDFIQRKIYNIVAGIETSKTNSWFGWGGATNRLKYRRNPHSKSRKKRYSRK